MVIKKGRAKQLSNIPVGVTLRGYDIEGRFL